MVGRAHRHRWNRVIGTPWLLCIGVLTLALCAVVRADTFGTVRYDARTDELVATMIYRGTNPNHTFSLQWGSCQDPSDSEHPSEIAADVLDSQWNDAAVHLFRKTVRFSLANLLCRPAKITLRTAPRFLYSIFVPRAPVGAP